MAISPVSYAQSLLNEKCLTKDVINLANELIVVQGVDFKNILRASVGCKQLIFNLALEKFKEQISDEEINAVKKFFCDSNYVW